MTGELGESAALTPMEVGAFLRDARFRWWVAVGWAIELFVGPPIRPHDDDVQVLPRDQGAFQAHCRRIYPRSSVGATGKRFCFRIVVGDRSTRGMIGG